MSDDKSNSNEGSFLDTVKSKTSSFLSATKANLIKLWQFLDSKNFIQVFVMLVLMILGIIFSARILSNVNNIGWMYFLIVVGLGLSGVAWYFATKRYMKGLLHYVVEQKYTRKIIAGGSFSYFEYKDLSEESVKTKFIEPISMTVSTLIAMLGISTTIIGLIRLVVKDLQTDSPVLWGFVAILTPIFATPIIPVIWSLNDARVKSWAEGSNTTWMVSGKYKARFNSFIAASAILSNLRKGLQSDQLVEQIKIILGILKVGVFVMLITVTVLVAYYFVWFRSHLRIQVVRGLSLKTYTIHLVENEKPQFDTIKAEEVKKDEKVSFEYHEDAEEEAKTKDETSIEETVSEEESSETSETAEIDETSAETDLENEKIETENPESEATESEKEVDDFENKQTDKD